VKRALSSLYERAIQQASQVSGVHAHYLREWCEASLITVTGTRSIVHKGPDSTAGLPNSALRALEEARVIRPEIRAGATWYELTHDTLIDPIRVSNAEWRKRREKIIRRASLKLQNAEKELRSADLTQDRSSREPLKRALAFARDASALSAQAGDGTRLEASYSVMGSAYLEQRKYDEARREFKQALDLAASIDDAAGVVFYLTRIAEVLQLQGDLEQAQSACEAALKSAHSVRDISLIQIALEAIGRVHAVKGDTESAIRYFSDMIDLDRHQPIGYVLRGSCYETDNRFDLAKEDYLTAHRLEPTDPMIPSYIGDLSRTMGDVESAISWYERALSADERQANVHRALGDLLSDEGKLSEAIGHYRRATELDSRNPDLMINFAYALRTNGQLDEAAKMCNAALSLDGSLGDAYMGLGGIYRRQAKYEDAIGAYLRAIELNGKNVLALASVALCHRRLGHASESERYIARARENWSEEFVSLFGLYNQACFLAMCGEVEGTIDALRQVFTNRKASVQQIEEDVDFEIVRVDSQFQEFLALARRSGDETQP